MSWQEIAVLVSFVVILIIFIVGFGIAVSLAAFLIWDDIKHQRRSRQNRGKS